jgi:hypothetical protein
MGEKLEKYGKNIFRLAIMLDDLCERQVKEEKNK